MLDWTTKHALLGRGKCYMGMGKYEKAYEDFSEVIRYCPDCAEAYNERDKCSIKLIMANEQKAEN